MYDSEGWEEGHGLRVQFEESFSALSGNHTVSSFSTPQPPFWGSEWSFLPMGHQMCKFTCVYLSTGFGRKTSSQNVISKQEKHLKRLQGLNFEIQNCKFERDELLKSWTFIFISMMIVTTGSHYAQ